MMSKQEEVERKWAALNAKLDKIEKRQPSSNFPSFGFLYALAAIIVTSFCLYAHFFGISELVKR